jgi:LPXTG-site transpeptidase (sortase) family protein
VLRRLAIVTLGVGVGFLVGIPAWWVASRPEPAAGSLDELGPAPASVEGEQPARPLALRGGEPQPSVRTRPAWIWDLPRPRPAARPARISIPAIGVRAPVVAVGVDDEGLMELPEREEAAWYRFGSTLGEPGSTVIAGHVDLAGAEGVFRRLGEVEPGDRVLVTTAADRAHAYRVVARRRYDKERLPVRIWTVRGPEVLTLVTCGGDYDAEARAYDSNTLLFAVPAPL